VAVDVQDDRFNERLRRSIRHWIQVHTMLRHGGICRVVVTADEPYDRLIAAWVGFEGLSCIDGDTWLMRCGRSLSNAARDMLVSVNRDREYLPPGLLRNLTAVRVEQISGRIPVSALQRTRDLLVQRYAPGTREYTVPTRRQDRLARADTDDEEPDVDDP
jgi:hypothetical protein